MDQLDQLQKVGFSLEEGETAPCAVVTLFFNNQAQKRSNLLRIDIIHKAYKFKVLPLAT